MTRPRLTFIILELEQAIHCDGVKDQLDVNDAPVTQLIVTEEDRQTQEWFVVLSSSLVFGVS